MTSILALLEETRTVLERDLMEFEVELVHENTEDTSQWLAEKLLRLRSSKFKKSQAMRKAKMRFGKKRPRSSHMTSAQKKQRQQAGQASANKRRGKKTSLRRFLRR